MGRHFVVLISPIETRMRVLWNSLTGHSIICDSSLETLQHSKGVFARGLSLKCVSVRQQAAKAEVEA